MTQMRELDMPSDCSEMGFSVQDPTSLATSRPFQLMTSLWLHVPTAGTASSVKTFAAMSKSHSLSCTPSGCGSTTGLRGRSLNPHWDDERIFQEARRIVGALIQKITYVDYLPKVLRPEVFNLVIGPYPGYNPQVNAGTANAFATAAYRYGHSLIRLQFDWLDANYRPLAIGNGLVSVNSRRVDEFLNIVLTTQLFQTNISPGMDLASLNIQ